MLKSAPRSGADQRTSLIKPARRRLDALQALRAFAAALVVLDHGAEFIMTRVLHAIEVPNAVYFFGALGVKLFFGISGFIILESARELPGGFGGAGEFMRRRIVRVVPLYWLVTLAYAIKQTIAGNSPAPHAWVQSLLFLPFADAHGQMRPIVGVGWSLNFELFFYVAFALSLLLPKRWGATAVGASLALWGTAGLLGCISPGAAIGTVQWGLLADAVLFFFIGGMAVGGLTHSMRVSGGGWLGFSGTVTLACCLVAGLAGAHWLDWIGDATANALALPICIGALALCALERPESAAKSPTQWLRRLWVAAGDASYSTYLIHTFTIAPLWALASRLGPSDRLTPIAWGLTMIPLATILGWLTYRLIEKPVTRLVGRLLLGQPGPKFGERSRRLGQV